MGGGEEDAYKVTKDTLQKFWKKRYEDQRDMEAKTPWKFCPWCGVRLAIAPVGHICGLSDFD